MSTLLLMRPPDKHATLHLIKAAGPLTVHGAGACEAADDTAKERDHGWSAWPCEDAGGPAFCGMRHHMPGRRAGGGTRPSGYDPSAGRAYRRHDSGPFDSRQRRGRLWIHLGG